MSFLGLLERKVTVLLKKKKGNMQIYSLNDDCGPAGFEHTASEDKIQRICVSAEEMDNGDERVESQKVILHELDRKNKVLRPV